MHLRFILYKYISGKLYQTDKYIYKSIIFIFMAKLDLSFLNSLLRFKLGINKEVLTLLRKEC